MRLQCPPSSYKSALSFFFFFLVSKSNRHFLIKRARNRHFPWHHFLQLQKEKLLQLYFSSQAQSQTHLILSSLRLITCATEPIPFWSFSQVAVTLKRRSVKCSVTPLTQAKRLDCELSNLSLPLTFLHTSHGTLKHYMLPSSSILYTYHDWRLHVLIKENPR